MSGKKIFKSIQNKKKKGKNNDNSSFSSSFTTEIDAFWEYVNNVNFFIQRYIFKNKNTH